MKWQYSETWQFLVSFGVLSPRFLVSRVPLVASTIFRALQQFSVLKISIGKEMQLPENWASSWKEEKSNILDFWLRSDYTYADSLIFRSIHPEVFWKIAYLKSFPRISGKVSLTEYFSKKFNTSASPHSNYMFTP